MPTEYRLLGAGVQRPDKRGGMHADKPDAYLALRVAVGKNQKYTEIVLTEREALRLIEELATGLRRLGGESS